MSLEAFEDGIVDLMMHDKWMLAGRSRHTADVDLQILSGRFTSSYGHWRPGTFERHEFESERPLTKIVFWPFRALWRRSTFYDAVVPRDSFHAN